MTEREALKILINATDLLSLKDKSKLSLAIEQASDEEVKSMGLFLSTYLEAEAEDLGARSETLKQLLAASGE